MSGILVCVLPETRICRQAFSSGGALRKHKIEWGSETGKEGKLVNGTLMRGLLPQATEAQPCWGLLRESVDQPCPRISPGAVKRLAMGRAAVFSGKMALEPAPEAMEDFGQRKEGHWSIGQCLQVTSGAGLGTQLWH